jgi:glycosyltransferase involved in cell wall biosynthesis
MVKVSIIMGIYNTNKISFLNQCIQSIKNQVFSEFEFLICDDGSDKITKEAISSLTRQDNRIRLITNESNEGLAYSLNRCINEAQGIYIARQDDDDYSSLDRLKKQLDFIERHPEYSIVGSFIYLFNESGVWGQRSIKEFPEKGDFLWGSQFFHPTVMMRKSDVLKVGGYRQAKETRRAEDYDLFVRMYAAGMRGYNLQEPLYYYREDRDAYKKRKYKYRIDEAILRYKSFKTLGLMPKGIPYIIKPLMVGLIPTKLIMQYRMKKDGGRKTHENSDSGQL